MKKVIGILEYNYHWEFFNTLRKICGNHDVVTFKDYRDAQKADYLDLLFVNTIKPNPIDILRWVRWKPKCKTVLSIHEINNEMFMLKPIINKFDALNVCYPPLKELLSKKTDKPIFTLPYAVFENKYKNYFNPYYVVPGRIERFRRDYSPNIKVCFETDWVRLKDLSPICYLGEPIGRYGNKVKQDADLSFDDFVSEDMYEDILRGCRGVVAPLRSPTMGYTRVIRESYGVSKACGAMFSAVKYGKPFYCNIPWINMDYHDYLLKDWQKYLEKEVLNTLL